MFCNIYYKSMTTIIIIYANSHELNSRNADLIVNHISKWLQVYEHNRTFFDNTKKTQ